ncbi:MAG: acyltransferase [Paraglaciecola sp.]|uniref:acyltransferase n=1 Tax=Paraglaciecola sp. TaxID=1920173 RepID=UPI0032988076
MNIKFLREIAPKIALIKSLYYSIKFKGIVVIGRGTKFNIHPGGKIKFKDKRASIYIGIHFSVSSGSTLDIYKNGILLVGKSVGIHKGTKVVVKENAHFTIGDSSFINENSRVLCRKKIEIGDDSSIGWHCTIADTDSHGIYINNTLTNPDSSVVIGDKVWVCANTTITKGTLIESNCIVGTNSVVLGKHLLSNNVYAGQPLRKVKEFDSWGSL